MTWHVELLGSAADLDRLVEWTSGAPLSVHRDSERFTIHWRALDAIEDPHEVHGTASAWLRVLAGSAIALGAKLGPLAVGQISKEIEGVTSIQALGMTVEHVNTDSRPDLVPEWLCLAADSEEVRDALQLRGDTANWFNLYKIAEIIEGDIGRLPTVSARQRTLFRRTANHKRAVGLEASRHGHSTAEPPKDPMALSRACGLIDGALAAWVAGKK